MGSNNIDTPAGLGRGRLRQVSDLRRPFAYTYAPEYVPTEGTSNNIRFNTGPGAANRQDPHMGLGRERPLQVSDTRQPFIYTYAPEYVPTEGTSNNIRLNTGPAAANRQDPHMVEPGIYDVQPADLMHSSAVQNDSNRSGPAKKFELSPLAPVFVPRNFQPEPRTAPPLIPPNNTINSSSDSYPIQELRQFLYDITINPGNFESKIQPLADCLNEHVDDDDTMRAVVNIIFDESVRQPNFRYSGARLCKYLCDELCVSSDRSNFKQLLLSRCCQEQKRREFLVESQDGGVYLRGFAMYLAELFSQLEFSNHKIKQLGEHLITVMETLLCHQSSDNVKCICQLLKLVGVYLEDLEKNKIPNNGASPEIDRIFSLLKEVSKNQDVPRDVRGMVNSVIELRSTDWGRAAENNDSVIEEHIPPSLNEPVMYGPDGRPITAEESLFLHSQYSNNASDPEEYEPYDETIFDNEMEEEMAAAYEVFLSEMMKPQ